MAAADHVMITIESEMALEMNGAKNNTKDGFCLATDTRGKKWALKREEAEELPLQDQEGHGTSKLRREYDVIGGPSLPSQPAAAAVLWQLLVGECRTGRPEQHGGCCLNT
eukprot:comp10724_c0_seq1/m.5383 comp10724_c0_seq1/g.5383  ORF comp10724_c0_seq1/g.5383 comp10724_c0_seq1/m.5383 type:complete len:110 (-) comp10724_c0_seq1:68-397(-)